MRLVITLLVTALVAACTKPAPAQVNKVETDDQKTLYALGYAVAENMQLTQFDLTAAELETVKQGFSDSILKKKAVAEPQEFMGKIRELQTVRMAAVATKVKESGKAYLDKVATEAGANKLPSGVVVIPIKEGTGPMPSATDQVRVHYHGTLTDGTVFDSSVERKEPIVFGLNQVVPCWTEGVQKIKVGGKAKLVCPSETAYGERGAGPKIGPGATLVFEVELLEIVKN